jgi:hypothetical protein
VSRFSICLSQSLPLNSMRNLLFSCNPEAPLLAQTLGCWKTAINLILADGFTTCWPHLILHQSTCIGSGNHVLCQRSKFSSGSFFRTDLIPVLFLPERISTSPLNFVQCVMMLMWRTSFTYSLLVTSVKDSGGSWILNGIWYVSNVSIIFDAPCLFLHHLPNVSLHFVALLCIFWN